MHRQFLSAFVLATLFVTSAFADLTVPKITSRVYDETATLSSDQKQSLEAKLAYYEDSTSTQIVVVIVNSLNGAEVSDYAIETGNQNHIGQAKKNNGVIILLAKNDHQGFIATGYGMEPTVTDAVASVIFRDVLRPALRQNDYYGGINAAIDSIAAASRGEFKGTGTRSKRSSENGSGFIVFIVIFIIFVVVRGAIGTGLRRTVVGANGANHGFMSGFLSALFWSNIFRGGGGGSGGSSFGGFGGGGFGGGGGGFSGGGGSFGGGGAGGSW